MAGYVALQRVDRVSVRALAWRGSARVEDAARSEDRVHLAARAAMDDRPLGERLVERWAIVREQWAITTFFLFDPESWR